VSCDVQLARALDGRSCRIGHDDAPSILTWRGLFFSANRLFNPTGISSLEQFLGIAIPVFGSSPKAPGGSGEGGRGAGEENPNLRTRERIALHTHSKAAVLAGMGS